ncbi:FCD domain-containing protein [Streptomyces sp. NPDC006365]|uniref:FCD domain-containing protein n=1 Tax=Streptomyces sp. NPDC006365 TaxID=3364744 RepID=UPI0036BCC4B9
MAATGHPRCGRERGREDGADRSCGKPSNSPRSTTCPRNSPPRDRRRQARRLGLHENVSPAVFAAQHHEIFDAVVGGDVSLARTAMRAHLRAVFSDIERIRAHSPELFASGSAKAPVRRNVVVWE